MLSFSVPLLLLATTVTSIQDRPHSQYTSAASDSQIRFALENNYDDTGPGAKGREFAYNTFKTLDEAILGYLDDPDTKLPYEERENAEERLKSTAYNPDEVQRFLPKTVEEYTGYKPEPAKTNPKQPLFLNKYTFGNKKVLYHEPNAKIGVLDLRGIDISSLKNLRVDKPVEQFRYHKLHPVKPSPLNLAHYSRDPDLQQAHDQFNPNPKYSYSYGVHDKHTGDSKSAHETRDGGVVRGYYTFVDPDGKQRTVHYVADDEQGFKATVQRTNTNAQ